MKRIMGFSFLKGLILTSFLGVSLFPPALFSLNSALNSALDPAPTLYAFSLAEAAKHPGKNTGRLEELTRIEGLVLDEADRDIILYGTKNPALPPLHLEDFIISLQNVAMQFSRVEGNTRYYSAPACSIDPTPETLARLNALQEKIYAASGIKKKEKAAKRYLKTCKESQTVSVFGIPFHSHFSKVMVDADYHMKRVVDGTEKTGIEGMVSLADLYMEKMRRTIETHGKPAALNALNRFWFLSHGASAREHKQLFRVVETPISLTSEREFTDEQGRRTQSGSADTLSAIFTGLFTSKFDALKQKFPIYQELENLYRWMALAKIVRKQYPGPSMPLSPEKITAAFNTKKTKVAERLPGRPNLIRETLHSGRNEWEILAPTCGGVNMAVEIKTSPADKPVEREELAKLKKRIATSRPVNTVSWEIAAR